MAIHLSKTRSLIPKHQNDPNEPYPHRPNSTCSCRPSNPLVLTIDRIFAYLGCIVDFLASNLPPIALQVLIPLIVPSMTTQLKENWLGKYIPRTMDSLTEYEKLIWEAQNFERTLQSISWTQENVLHEWCLRAGEWWGKQHKMDVLERVR